MRSVKTLLRISQQPLSGPLCRFNSNELRDLRRMVIERFPKHLIFYRLESENVLIIRIIHGARDLESLL